MAPNYWAKELRQYLGKGCGEDHVLQPEGLPTYVKPITYPEPKMGRDFDANAIDQYIGRLFKRPRAQDR